MRELTGRSKQIADGISGLSLEKTNAYRKKWGLPLLQCLPATREVCGVLRFDQPGILLDRDPYDPKTFPPPNPVQHKLMFARGCFDDAIRELEAGRECLLKMTDHSKRAIASTKDGSLRVWQSDQGLEFAANVHWLAGQQLDEFKAKQVSPTPVIPLEDIEERIDEDGILLIVCHRAAFIKDIVVTAEAAMGSASEFWLPDPVLQLQEPEASPGIVAGSPSPGKVVVPLCEEPVPRTLYVSLESTVGGACNCALGKQVPIVYNDSTEKWEGSTDFCGTETLTLKFYCTSGGTNCNGFRLDYEFAGNCQGDVLPATVSPKSCMCDPLDIEFDISLSGRCCGESASADSMTVSVTQ